MDSNPPNIVSTMEEENAAPHVVADEATKQSAAVAAAAAVEANADDDDAPEDKGDDAEDTPAPAADTIDGASSGRGKRVRKSTTNYVPEEETKKEIIIPRGKGEKLQDMPNVVARFQEVTWSTPSLKMLYSIVFGVGKKADFKKHLLQFNGLVFPEGKEEAEKEKVQLKMYKLKIDQLKEVMDLCDIDRSQESFGKKNPDKDMLCNRFLEWLEEPKASGKKLKGISKKSSAKRKSSSSAATAAAASKAPKKSPEKKSKKELSKPKPKKKKAAAKPADDDDDIEVNIPGVSTDKIRARIEGIVANADRESVTVKDVRKKLEEWLDTDLSAHKDAIRALVMDVM